MRVGRLHRRPLKKVAPVNPGQHRELGPNVDPESLRVVDLGRKADIGHRKGLPEAEVGVCLEGGDRDFKTSEPWNIRMKNV